MRWLIYQNDKSPGWVYDEICKQADYYGHKLVKWAAGLTYGKDFDGVLAIPETSYMLDNIGTCSNDDDEVLKQIKDDSDYRSMSIGRGIYEGLKANHPNTYVVAYNTDNDDPADIHLFQGFSLNRDGYDNLDYKEWADLIITPDTIKRAKLVKAFAYLQKNPGFDTGFRVSVMGENWWNSDRRRMLLLNN